mgnify:CR=1 FL=1
MKFIKKERGFTLIEVVASIVIIGIVLISFSQLFIQSNKTAAHNNEKLVLINFADAELERIQATKLPVFAEKVDLINHIKTTFTREMLFNSRYFYIQINPTQDSTSVTSSTVTESELNLVNIKVTVSLCSQNPNGNPTVFCLDGPKSSTEGYVSID